MTDKIKSMDRDADARVHGASGVKKRERICAGFGDRRGVCSNPSGSNPYWCDTCDIKRKAHITEQLEAMVKMYEPK